ncbi:MAG: UDP-N-acetylglucosamine 2-epimerase (non-hydrolyzing) [Thermoproteota archaeon]|nr:UDP-N-acetylglucosamine 2-epimerase (non-hydrolyzing) [Thermoproteota archaeon]
MLRIKRFANTDPINTTYKYEKSIMTLALVTGTRPEIIKLYPVMKILDRRRIDYKFIYTGQHYDYNLSVKFIEEFNIRRPDYNISLATSLTPLEQVSQIMVRLCNIFQQFTPSLVIVQGDTNSVLAGALAAVKSSIPIAHVEAGLRSDNWKMPEEHNRRIVDHISDVLFAPTLDAERNLKEEHVHGDIYVVGNTVIDAIRLGMQPDGVKTGSVQFIKMMKSDETFDNDFVLVTLHRPDNVDNPEFLKEVLSALSASGHKYIFPMHPRTVKHIHEFGLEKLISSSIKVIEPTGYFDFLNLLKMCKFVITDSGGIQEEVCSPLINKCALVVHTSTERPESVRSGHTILCNAYTQQKILEGIKKIQEQKRPEHNVCPYGSGYAGEKIIETLENRFFI